MAKAPTEIRSLARSHGPSMIMVLATIARQKTAPASARVAAASSLLDRGYGKPEQPNETNADIQITIRQILDGTAQPKLVNGRVIDNKQPEVVSGSVVDKMQPNVSGMPEPGCNGAPKAKPKR